MPACMGVYTYAPTSSFVSSCARRTCMCVCIDGACKRARVCLPGPSYAWPQSFSAAQRPSSAPTRPPVTHPARTRSRKQARAHQLPCFGRPERPQTAQRAVAQPFPSETGSAAGRKAETRTESPAGLPTNWLAGRSVHARKQTDGSTDISRRPHLLLKTMGQASVTSDPQTSGKQRAQTSTRISPVFRFP